MTIARTSGRVEVSGSLTTELCPVTVSYADLRSAPSSDARFRCASAFDFCTAQSRMSVLARTTWVTTATRRGESLAPARPLLAADLPRRVNVIG